MRVDILHCLSWLFSSNVIMCFVFAARCRIWTLGSCSRSGRRGCSGTRPSATTGAPSTQYPSLNRSDHRTLAQWKKTWDVRTVWRLWDQVLNLKIYILSDKLHGIVCGWTLWRNILFNLLLEELKAIRLKIRRIILEHLLTFKTFHHFIHSLFLFFRQEETL